MKNAIIAALLLSLVVGCSDPKAANERNFADAINAYLDKNPCIASNRAFKFPQKIDSTMYQFERNKNYLNAFADIGFLTKSENKETIERKRPLSFSNITEKIEAVTITYDLTEEGRKYFREGSADNFTGGRMNGFYCGNLKVGKIVQFTEPADMFGKKMCEVQCTYTVKDMQGWVKNKAVIDADNTVKRYAEAAEKPEKHKVVLVLTNNGWVHQKM